MNLRSLNIHFVHVFIYKQHSNDFCYLCYAFYVEIKRKTKNGQISHDHCSGQPGPCSITKHLFLFMCSNVWNTIRLPSQVIVNKPEDILRSSANAPHPACQLECSAIPPCLNKSGNFIIVTFNPEYHNTILHCNGSSFESNQPTYNGQTWYLFIHLLLCS